MATLIDDAPLSEFEQMKQAANRRARWQRSATLRSSLQRIRDLGVEPSDRDLARFCAARETLQRRVQRRARRPALLRWVTPGW